MRTARPYCWLPVLLAGSLSGACTAPGPAPGGVDAGAELQQIPRVSALYAKAAERPPVHRFRKPLRDERDRVLRQLSAECERLMAELRTQHVAAEALSGAAPAQQAAADAATEQLETSLAGLSAAARSGDAPAMRSAHAAALAAYSQIRGPID